MKWVPDRTGRFAKRPHYLPEELDEECERVIVEFLKQKYGRVDFPVKTDDLTVFIEQKADLDSYADLSEEEGDVDGVTEFTPGQRPVVRIADRLSAPCMENRLRTTLTHEWGHVHLHQFMFEVECRQAALFESQVQPVSNKCKRENIVGASETNWMEWQAGYVCGAILMPTRPLIETVQAFRKQNGLLLTKFAPDSDAGQRLIDSVAARFQTSKDAARVRLLKKQLFADFGLARVGDLFQGKTLF
ncbi:MAG TPA: ImmA/IrrE family metallo-endopeptidase [Bryobacteraceae bacterium]